MAETADRPRDSAPPRAAPPVLEITVFTDPLCCWSWGFEPQLRRLRYGFAGRIAWRVRLCGMIGDWKVFSDPLNDIHRPVQMGPLWLEAATLTGMPMEPALWVHDAPASSWPACLAVKAAGLQSPAAGDLYLRRLREALMIAGRNVARQDVLRGVALDLAVERPDLLDVARFERDLAGPEARAALEEDVREARFRGVQRYPCLGLRRSGAAPSWIVGWRPWPVLAAAITAAVPDLGPERRPASAKDYARYWGGATQRETEVAVDGSAGPGGGAGTSGEWSSGPGG